MFRKASKNRGPAPANGWLSGSLQRCLAIEEQRLADRGFHRIGLERFGDQERVGEAQQAIGKAKDGVKKVVDDA